MRRLEGLEDNKEISDILEDKLEDKVENRQKPEDKTISDKLSSQSQPSQICPDQKKPPCPRAYSQLRITRFMNGASGAGNKISREKGRKK